MSILLYMKETIKGGGYNKYMGLHTTRSKCMIVCQIGTRQSMFLSVLKKKSVSCMKSLKTH